MTVDIASLVSDNLDIWTTAVERKSGAGRGAGRRIHLYGIDRLRALILDLAMSGRLAQQDASDEHASKLLSHMEAERRERVAAGEMKSPKVSPDLRAVPYEVPAGWMWIPLGATGNVFTGNSINSQMRAKLESTSVGLPFVATKDIGYGFDPIKYKNGLTVSDSDKSFSIARADSVFVCAEGGSAGKKIAISDRAICFGNKLIANETWSVINPRFVLYYYLSDIFFSQFSKEMTGIIGGISRAKFLALAFPLPPYAEQQRIVAKVDELMALCDALGAESAAALAAHQALVEALLAILIASTEAADLATNWSRLEAHFDTLFTTEASIDVLKKTILDLAVRGLIVDQDVSDEPAAQLLQRISSVTRGKERRRTSARSAFRCPPGWEWATVQELLNPSRGISYGVIKLGTEPTRGGVPTLRCSDVKPGFLDLSGVRNVTENIESDYARTRLEGGEIVVNIRGTLGGVALIPKELQGYNVAREVAVVPVSDEMSNRYVMYLMLSPYFWDHIQNNLRGIAYMGLNLGILREIPVPVPPIAEQLRIVAKVDELMALCDALRARITDAAAVQGHLADAITERAAA